MYLNREVGDENFDKRVTESFFCFDRRENIFRLTTWKKRKNYSILRNEKNTTIQSVFRASTYWKLSLKI